MPFGFELFGGPRTKTTYRFISGSGGSHVTETTTYIDKHGQQSETKTYSGADPKSIRHQFGLARQISTHEDPKWRDNNLPSQRRQSRKSHYRRGWGGGWEAHKPTPRTLQLRGGFEEVRDQCLKGGAQFQDPDFPANNSSIFPSKMVPPSIQWKRPNEICSNPQLFVDGVSRFDVVQGELGNCWFVAPVASLVGNKELLYRVVPRDQGFQDKYAGVFHFNFWQAGKWVEVVVDDRLPTKNGKLVFMQSTEKNEFWTPLLEKAYAKLHGSYEALESGISSEAMEDFTGGLAERFKLKEDPPPNLFAIMLKASEKGSLIGCSIEGDSGELRMPNGLVQGHAYTVTAVRNIQTSMGQLKVPLVRVRNPWGNKDEWTGAYSDKSRQWMSIPESEKRSIGLTFDDDGEFWMSFDDFRKNFTKLEICHLGPDSYMEGRKSVKHWEATDHVGSWIKRVNAGGCINHQDTFWTNPQYRVDVIDGDPDDDDNSGTLIVALMQTGARKAGRKGANMLIIGYVIYQLTDPSRGLLDRDFIQKNRSVAKSPAFINLREIVGRHRLPPGHYCIIPSTFEPFNEGNFLLRIFSEKPNPAGEMDEETRVSKTQPTNDEADKNQGLNDSMYKAYKVIAGEDGEIDAYELQTVLDGNLKKEFKFDGFNIETCRSLIALMDEDHSGMLGFDEFKKLWYDLHRWKWVFKKFDKDNNGTFDGIELREAFRASGFQVSNATFSAMVQRYSNKEGKINFDDYIHCVVRMKSMFDVWNELDKKDENSTSATIELDEFIQTTMYS